MQLGLELCSFSVKETQKAVTRKIRGKGKDKNSQGGTFTFLNSIYGMHVPTIIIHLNIRLQPFRSALQGCLCPAQCWLNKTHVSICHITSSHLMLWSLDGNNWGWEYEKWLTPSWLYQGSLQTWHLAEFVSINRWGPVTDPSATWVIRDHG